MAANDPIVGTLLFASETAQRQQTVLGYLDATLAKTTTATAVPYMMFPKAFQYFQIAPGTQVFKSQQIPIQPQGFLIVKIRPTAASKTLDSTGSTSGFVKLTVLEQDLANRNSEPITRILTDADRNTSRLPDDPAFPNSTSVFSEAYAFQPGNGLAWLFAGPQNLDLRTTA